jgi:O-antigen ligase
MSDPAAGSPHTFLGVAVNQRVAALVSGAFETDVAVRLERTDSARYSGLFIALDSIVEHPLSGRGLGSTINFDDPNESVIHNIYLGAWADLGLLGFLAIAGFTLCWTPSFRRYARLIRLPLVPSDKAWLHSGFVGLLAFAFVGLYHPIGVEVSDWIHFIIPASLYFPFVRRRSRIAQ